MVVAAGLTALYAGLHGHAEPGAASARQSGSTTTPMAAHAKTPAVGRTSPGSGSIAIVTPWVPPIKVRLDDPVVGTTNLQPPMVRAYRAAAAAAAGAGHPMSIRSGWRSAAYQQVLFDRAVARYGSSTEAAKWVLPPQDSAHVQGTAVDVEPLGAARWLEAHGRAYGLCRTYANEWWHFELVALGPVATCPQMKPSAAG